MIQATQRYVPQPTLVVKSVAYPNLNKQVTNDTGKFIKSDICDNTGVVAAKLATLFLVSGACSNLSNAVPKSGPNPYIVGKLSAIFSFLNPLINFNKAIGLSLFTINFIILAGATGIYLFKV